LQSNQNEKITLKIFYCTPHSDGYSAVQVSVGKEKSIKSDVILTLASSHLRDLLL
jgi:hypothetical protein